MNPKQPTERPAILAEGSLAQLAAQYMFEHGGKASLKEIVAFYKEKNALISAKKLVTAIVQYSTKGRAFERIDRGVYKLTPLQSKLLSLYATKK